MSSNGSCSSGELPHPFFPGTSSSARHSYATTSPPTPNADHLFFRPPKSSPSTPSVPSHDGQGQRGSSSSSSKKARGAKGTRSSGMSHMILADSPDTADYLARLPNDGVFIATGLDARSLADMLSPPGSGSGSGSTSSRRKKKGKKKEKAKLKSSSSPSPSPKTSIHTSTTASPTSPPSTPPRLPPKPLKTVTPRSARTTATTDTSLTHSLSISRSSAGASNYTESEVHSPQTALHGRRASASSHHILAKPSLQSLLASHPTSARLQGVHVPDPSESLDHGGNKRDSYRLEEALAALPWAEPPPRRTSQLQAGSDSLTGPVSSTIRAEGSEPPSARTPSYSFLASDPTAPGYHTHHSEALSSRSSTSSQRQPPSLTRETAGQDVSPISVQLSSRRSSRAPSVPYSPTSASHASIHGRNFSAASAYSGMADVPTPLASGFNDSPVTDRYSHEHSPNSGGTGTGTRAGTGRRSPGSTMATLGSGSQRAISPGAPSRSPNEKRGKGFSGWSFRSGTGSRSKSRASTRTKSTKSTRSTKSKRGSNTTLSHFASGGGAGRWEIRKWEELEDEDMKSLIVRKAQEESMDICALVGRAVVLERMLRNGKRVSSQSVRQLLRSITPPSHPSHHPPGSGAVPHLPSNALNKRAKHRSSASASMSVSPVNGPGAGRKRKTDRHSNSNSNSLSVSVHSRSFSQPDSHNHAHAHAHAHARDGHVHSPTSSSPTNSGRRRSAPSRGSMSLRERLARKLHRSESREDIFTELDSHESNDDDEEEEWDDPTLFPPRVSHFRTRTKEVDERGEERVGGKGVIVFPEEMEVGVRPITPPEKARVRYQHACTHSRSHSGSGLGDPRHGYTGGRGCTSPCGAPGCFAPTSPTPLLAEATSDLLQCHPHLPHSHSGVRNQYQYQYQPDVEKGALSHPSQELDQAERPPMSMPMYDSAGRPYYPQSPHLGHRSPGWKKRQSVLSYISTGVWEERRKRRWRIALGVGAGLLVLLVAGLLIGLLVGKEHA